MNTYKVLFRRFFFFTLTVTHSPLIHFGQSKVKRFDCQRWLAQLNGNLGIPGSAAAEGGGGGG